ncbi:hypothetical protein B0H13DRAFT_2364968, partial [Mycena leptocephala]
PNTYNGSDSDDEYTNNASSHSSEEGWRDDDAAPTPTPSRSTHAPRTPRHISLWGFNLFGNGRGRGVALEGGDDRSGKKRRGSHSGTAPGASTDKDVSATDDARRGGAGTEQERRTGRKTQETAPLAAALAELNTPEFEGFPCSGSGKLPPQPTFRAPPPGYNRIPSPFMRRSSSSGRLPTLWHTSRETRTQPTSMDSRTRCWAEGCGGIAEPECLSHSTAAANAAEIAYVGIPPHKPKSSTSKSKSGRSTKSKSSATSSTLASPPPTSSGFPHLAGVRDSESPTGKEEFGAFATQIKENGTNSENKKNEKARTEG